MPAVPKPAEPCAPRARRWTLSPVSPPPPRSRLRAAAGGPGTRPAGCSEGQRTDRRGESGMRGPGPVAARPGNSTVQPGAGGSLRRVLPSGPTPDFGRSLYLDGFRMEWGALHSHVLAVFFFLPPLIGKRGAPSVILYFGPRGVHCQASVSLPPGTCPVSLIPNVGEGETRPSPRGLPRWLPDERVMIAVKPVRTALGDERKGALRLGWPPWRS